MKLCEQDDGFEDVLCTEACLEELDLAELDGVGGGAFPFIQSA